MVSSNTENFTVLIVENNWLRIILSLANNEKGGEQKDIESNAKYQSNLLPLIFGLGSYNFY